MTDYQELKDIAHAIGYHAGRMRAEGNHKAERVDQEMLSQLLRRHPSYRANFIETAYYDGRTEALNKKETTK